MDQAPTTRVVGRIRRPGTPEENVRRAHVLEKELDLVNPYPRPRGFLFKAKTYEDYKLWRQSQPNPRFW